MVYQYLAYNQSGRIVKGKLAASTKETATELLSYAGYRTVNLKPYTPFFSLDKLLTDLSRVTPPEVIIFYQQLAMLLETGNDISSSLEILQKQMENQRKSLEADITEHDLEIRITERNLQELRRQLRLAEAKSESDGVVTWVADRIGSAVNVGDPLARIADLNSFKVEGSISDMHSDKLKLDGPIKVRVSGIDLYGKIVNIDPSMENGIARFIVELEQNNHANLRPNLRVDVFVITNTKENVVRVENGPFVNGSGIQDIFVIDDDKAIRKTVTIGAVNFDYVEITDQVHPGDEVITSDMTKYIQHTEINKEEG